jgi:hypothetical protein
MAPFTAGGQPLATQPTPLRSAPSSERDALARVARALRGARARTGLSEQQVVGILAGQGVAVDLPMLQEAEQSGDIALALASCLADVYGTTTDGLAGRRLYRRRLETAASDRSSAVLE